ncbi:hypothetical protein [Methylosinus sp. Ce-a6]|nr:hypothetical protein [Methylosinus sp. Ce-a6]
MFANSADDLDGLRDTLERRLRNVEIDIVDCAALFVARDRARASISASL